MSKNNPMRLSTGKKQLHWKWNVTSTRLAPITVKPTRSIKPIDLHRESRETILNDLQENESIAYAIQNRRKKNDDDSVSLSRSCSNMYFPFTFGNSWQTDRNLNGKYFEAADADLNILRDRSINRLHDYIICVFIECSHIFAQKRLSHSYLKGN